MTPTTKPRNVPSFSPSVLPTELLIDDNIIGGNIQLFYEQNVDDILALSFSKYARALEDATQEAMRFITNDTSFDVICDQFNLTTDKEISNTSDKNCFLSNLNPYADNYDNNTTTTRKTRRSMLNELYSYKYDDFDNGSSGWWQGRMINLQYCTVLKIEWNPNDCNDFNNDIVENTPEDVQYAFGTFNIVADENSLNYWGYIQNKLGYHETSTNTSGQSVSLFLDQLTRIMREEKNYSQFEAIKISLQNASIPYIPPSQQDKVHKSEYVFLLIYVLYAFIIFYIVLAILVKLHAFKSGADNVHIMSVVFFAFHRYCAVCLCFVFWLFFCFQSCM